VFLSKVAALFVISAVAPATFASTFVCTFAVAALLAAWTVGAVAVAFVPGNDLSSAFAAPRCPSVVTDVLILMTFELTDCGTKGGLLSRTCLGAPRPLGKLNGIAKRYRIGCEGAQRYLRYVRHHLPSVLCDNSLDSCR
jgi:hypothetical protein